MGQREDSSRAVTAALAPLLLCLVAAAPYNEVQPPPARLNTGSVQCRTEYTTVWDTQYQEKETQECVTNYEKVCHTVNERLCKATTRQECSTVYEKSCQTVYKSVWVDQYKTEYEPYTETECTTEYKDDCEYQWEGHGNNKVWAPIPGTCRKNPYHRCQDVPRQQCRQVPDQVCTNQALQQCEDIPRQHCTAKHKKVPVRVSKNVPKKVCDTGYGYSANVPSALPASNPEAVLDIGRTTNLVKNNKIVFADK